jgi:hypothetical protein
MNIWITNASMQHLALATPKFMVDSRAASDQVAGELNRAHVQNEDEHVERTTKRTLPSRMKLCEAPAPKSQKTLT